MSERQPPHVFETTVRGRLPYLLYLPRGYHEGVGTWPLMLFLHGAGERGDDLEQVKKHGPPRIVEECDDFPFIVVSPQCPADEWWDSRVLIQLLEQLIEDHRVDEDRVYLTGLSMGGYGTWDLATRHPARFAAVVPICGGGTPHRVSRLKDVPAWVFHGAKDGVVGIGESQRMVDALEACGGTVRFTVYPEAQHDSWTQTYADPGLYEWLLSCRRCPPSQAG